MSGFALSGCAIGMLRNRFEPRKKFEGLGTDRYPRDVRFSWKTRISKWIYFEMAVPIPVRP